MTPRRRFLAAVLALPLAAALLAPAARASEGKTKDKPEASQSPFIELPTLTAAVIRPDGRRGVLTVQAVVYVPNAPQRLRASQSIPLLLNAYVPALQAWAYRLPPGAVPDVDALAFGLQKATDGVLKPGTRVLLGGVMVN
jgi:hypothetical protein